MIRYGIISEIDAAKGLARVSFEEDDIVSDWLRISVPNSFKNKDEVWFDVQEPVWCLMDENSENGIIGGAYYHEGNLPSPESSKDRRAVTFEDGTSVDYDRSTGILTIDCAATVNIKAVGQVNIDTSYTLVSGDLEITGNLQVSGPITAGQNISATGNIESSADVKAGVISLLTHKHGGVTTGGGVTTPSVP